MEEKISNIRDLNLKDTVLLHSPLFKEDLFGTVSICSNQLIYPFTNSEEPNRPYAIKNKKNYLC